MKKIFADNQWGYDINTTNPFWIALYNLREVAKESIGEENTLDLSRGDPGYGFAPCQQSREFYSFLLFLDTLFNNFNQHFVYNKQNYEEIKKEIYTKTQEYYSPIIANKLLNDYEHFIQEILTISQKQNLGFSERDILFEIFKYASVSGGCYHDPQGEKICRAIVADWHSKKLRENIHADDLIFIKGVSDGIGTFFKLMDEKEGIGYLKAGDTVCATSPSYAPYNMIFKNRGLNVISFSVDPTTGQPDEKTLKDIQEYSDRIKLFILIDPNNPTGFIAPDSFKENIVALAEKNNAIILTDEVYFAFFNQTKSIYSMAKKRTLRIDARSKIERSTGLRFGDYIVTDEINDYISNNILNDYLPKDLDFKKALLLAKAPGGCKGEFMHTTFVPGPSQFLGVCHIIFGEEERNRYISLVQNNVDEFASILNLKAQGNTYYTVFDLNEIASANKKDMIAEEKFFQLAKKGVVLIPSYLFFSRQDQQSKDCRSSARACLPNLSFDNVQKAARIIKEVLS